MTARRRCLLAWHSCPDVCGGTYGAKRVVSGHVMLVLSLSAPDPKRPSQAIGSKPVMWYLPRCTQRGPQEADDNETARVHIAAGWRGNGGRASAAAICARSLSRQMPHERSSRRAMGSSRKGRLRASKHELRAALPRIQQGQAIIVDVSVGMRLVDAAAVARRSRYRRPVLQLIDEHGVLPSQLREEPCAGYASASLAFTNAWTAGLLPSEIDSSLPVPHRPGLV